MNKGMEKKLEQISLQLAGKVYKIPQGNPLLALAVKMQQEYSSPIVGAKIDNEIVDLYTEVLEPVKVEFLDLATEDGMRIYRQSLVFLMTRAAYELSAPYLIRVEHSLGKSYYCELIGSGQRALPLELITLEAKMRQIIELDEPIIPQTMHHEKAVEILSTLGFEDKVDFLNSIKCDQVTLHSSGSFSNYSYSKLVPNTGCLGTFKLEPHDKGFLLRFPEQNNPAVVAPYPNLPKLDQVFRESEKWANILEISNLSGLVKMVDRDFDAGNELIHIAEALHEKKIAQIADEIYARRDKVRIVLIAGPSSSGKTTFAQRLAIQLRVCGLRPISLSLDDYFVNREDTPLDENGEYDYEALEAIDVSLFNEHLEKLINGKSIECPVFNFHRGARESTGKMLQIPEESPLIIEGIHGLDERLTSAISRENKYKIYISALTQLSVDDHNRIPTTDTRLIRRMVRDNQFRSQNALTTLKRWPSVRRGEERNIFPYQEDADIMFNSALVYELSILKAYACPLLKAVGQEEEEYSDAQRLFTLLSYFPELKSLNVPLNSILREFIGGSSIHGK